MERRSKMPAIGLVLILAVAVGTWGAGASPALAGAAQPEPAKAGAAKKLDFAYTMALGVTSSSVVFKWMSEEVTKRSNGTLQMVFHSGTLITKQQEVIDAVKSGNVAIGSPDAGAPSIVPELNVFMVPYLMRDYDHAYKVWNGDVGKQLDEMIQQKYGLKILLFYDYGFKNFWNSKRPITKPDDLKGLKMRVPAGRIFVDTVNAMGGSAVAMGWNEVIPAVQQGVVDGGDLPVVNYFNAKVYEVAKYISLTGHNYGPSFVAMNPAAWKGLTPDQQKLILEVGLQAQKRVRAETEGVDSLEGAKKLLGDKGVQISAPDRAPFRKIAEEKVWPKYKKEYPEFWDKIVSTK
jgi:tripartite ATP-independent transporter DctP family solute receptor